MENRKGAAMNLTTEQKMVLTTLPKFITSNDSFLTISGAAGTGKTTSLVLFLQNTRHKVCLCATTNKAVKVLDRMCEERKLDVPRMTIHSLLGLVVKNTYSGKELVKKGGSKSREYDLIVVDEASMVDRLLYSYIRADVEANGTKYLFVGDVAQLPPIGEDTSVVFENPTINLTTVVRQAADNPIIGLANAIRNTDESEFDVSPYIKRSKDGKTTNGVIALNQRQFEDLICSAFSDKTVMDDIDKFRVVCWTNKQVEYYNKMIRALHYVEPYEVGEWLRCREPITVINVVSGDLPETEICLTAQSEGRVTSVEQTVHPWIKQDLPFYRLGFKSYDQDVVLWVPMPETATEIAAIVKQKVDSAYSVKSKELKARLWREVYLYRDLVADVVPVHAMTTHAAQGSTFKNTFVDINNIGRNRNRQELLRCCYTAITRSSNLLVMNNRII